MQSDDLFVRKCRRHSPRPALTSVPFEPKWEACVRTRVVAEWPPRREEDGVDGEGPSPVWPGPVLRHVVRGHIIQRSNSDVTLGDLETSGSTSAAVGKMAGVEDTSLPDSPGLAPRREFGSLSSLERQTSVQPANGEEPVAESPAVLRFKDPLLLLGLPAVEPEADGFSRTLSPPEGEMMKQTKVAKSEAQNKKGKSSPIQSLQAGDSLASGAWVHSFAHYDVQSILFDLMEAASSRDSIGRKKNITSGASAASQLQATCHSAPPSPVVGGVSSEGGGGEDPEAPRETALPPDEGDGNDNDLLLSCPHFRNETGGEERPGLGWAQGWGGSRLSLQIPNDAVSILEEPRESSLLQQQLKSSYFIEHADLGAHYYRKYFYMKDHQNFFGIDEKLGPVAYSFRREEKEGSSGAQYNYRIIFRTTEMKTLRGSILEESVSTGARHATPRGLSPKRVLEHVLPEVNQNCLRLASNSPKVPETLLTLDEQRLNFQHKVGVMYCRAKQSSEEDMYNNKSAGPAFEEFLDLLGERVRLLGFEKYRAQLDTKTDTTGTHSLYTKYQDYEIMFHVSTMLPYTSNNTQQLLRKRHIGNDIVTIVFQEPGALPFTPKTIRSHFQHVFIVVQVHHPCTEHTYYRVAVTRSKDIPLFGPFFPKGARFPRSPAFREFLLAKAVNAENAAEKSEKFRSMATRTRQGYLKDLAENYVTTTPIDSSTKFPLLSLGGKRKDKLKGAKGAELHSAGALVWLVTASGGSAGEEKHPCLLAVSVESVVLIERSSCQVVFNCNSRDVIGWKVVTEGGASGGPSLDIFYGQGELISVSIPESHVDDIREVVQRLQVVSRGCEVQEVMPLRDSVGHPGFMLSEDGFVVELQQSGYTESKGLRLGARVVRMCGRSLVGLPAGERASLLRSTPRIHLTIIPPDKNGKPARSLSELCQKAWQDTEHKPEGAQSREAWVLEEKVEREAQDHQHHLSSAPPLQRAISYHDDATSRPPELTALRLTRSCSLEKPQPQLDHRAKYHFYDNRVQRSKMHIYEIPGELQDATPDLILAVNPKLSVGEGDPWQQNVGHELRQDLAPPCHEVQPTALLDSPDSATHTFHTQNMENSLNNILMEANDSIEEEWQSISAVESACRSMLEAMSWEERRVMADGGHPLGDGLVTATMTDPKMKDGVESDSSELLDDKVSQLETMLKRLQDDLQKEKEDKAQLQAEVLTLRQSNQRLQEESQSTVARLIKVTELLCNVHKH